MKGTCTATGSKWGEWGTVVKEEHSGHCRSPGAWREGSEAGQGQQIPLILTPKEGTGGYCQQNRTLSQWATVA